MKKKIFILFILLFSYGKILALTEFSALSYTLYENHVAEVIRPSTGNYVFNEPTKVVIPTTVTYNGEDYTVIRIGEKAFLYQSNLYEVEIPESVTSIGNSAFYSSHLTSLIIPNGVTQIEGYAFEYCTHLTSVSIGTNLKTIGNMAFTGCDSITTVTWNAKNGASINFGNQVEAVSFGNQVEVVPKNLCSGMTLLTSVTLPQKLSKIGSGAFSNCTGLTSIIIPDSVTSIGANAFSNCTGLITITIPNSVTSIGSNAFNGCSGLVSVTFGNSVTDIESGAFGNCIGITSISFPESVTNIGGGAFSNCYSLSPSITIPANVTSIGKNAFSNCTGLTSIIIEGSPRLSTGSFAGCINLLGIYCLSDTPPIANAEINSLSDTNGCPIYYPCGQYNAYRYIFAAYLNRLEENPECSTYYTVTFKDWDGTVLKIEQVEEGHAATAPANPTREGYTFVGWDKSFTNVQSNLTVTAQYQKNETPSEAITVRLKASSVSWSKVNLYYWADGIDSPAWPGTAITKDAQGWYSYTFPASITSVSIIWNDGNNQTTDITNITQSTCYKLNSTSGKSITVSTINCEEDIVAVTGVTLNKKTLQINKGGNNTLTATVLPANATNKAVTWTSSNTSVATVSNTGKITAKTAGVSTISCETVDGHFKAECYIVVTDASQGCDYSFEPTAASVIQFEATDLSFSAFEGGTFVILTDAEHSLYLMYYGSLVNGALPAGEHPVSSIEQNGNILYSIGGDDSYDYGSFMATNFTADGSYSAAYYIIAGNMSVGTDNGIYAKLVSVNGTDIIVTYRWTQDVEIVPVVDGAIKILRDGQILILRGDKIYTLQGQEVR